MFVEDQKPTNDDKKNNLTFVDFLRPEFLLRAIRKGKTMPEKKSDLFISITGLIVLIIIVLGFCFLIFGISATLNWFKGNFFIDIIIAIFLYFIIMFFTKK